MDEELFKKAVELSKGCNRAGSGDFFIGDFNLTVFYELTTTKQNELITNDTKRTM